MPRLRFNTIPEYSADQIADALDADDIANCYLDITSSGLSLRRRPGLAEFLDLGTDSPGQGIFEWEATGKVVAVSNGNVYQINEDKTFSNLTGDALDSVKPVVFSDGSKLDGTPFLYLANSKLVYLDNGGTTAYPADPATPSNATHAVYLNLRFLANTPKTNRFLFTDTNPDTGILEPDYWSSSDNPLTAESRGDTLLGLWSFLEEIYAWGSQSLEIWQDDGVTPFVPIPQATAHVGLEAVYSVVVANNTLYALCVIDGTRCVVRMSGRSPEVISGPIENVLAGYSTVSDAVGQVISAGGTHIYLLQFPSAGKTWAYNMDSNSWVPWGTWDRSSGTQGQFVGQHSVFVKSWNKHLIMSRIDGKIYELSTDIYVDDTTPIQTYRRTVWEDHGSGTRKRSKRLRIKIKTGATVNGAAYLRWADDGAEEWTEYVELPLYPEGKRDFIIDIPQLGMYYSRRYEVSISDDADLCVVWLDEDVEILRF